MNTKYCQVTLNAIKALLPCLMGDFFLTVIYMNSYHGMVLFNQDPFHPYSATFVFSRKCAKKEKKKKWLKLTRSNGRASGSPWVFFETDGLSAWPLHVLHVLIFTDLICFSNRVSLSAVRGVLEMNE